MELKDGIFAEFRSKGIDVSSNNYFSVVFPFPYFTNSGFCEQSNIRGSEVSNIVSDDMTLAFASQDRDSPNNKYIDFFFNKSKISVQGIAIQTLCGPPKEIIFEGSTEKNSTWETVCSKNTIFPSHDIIEIVCLNPKAFSHFRLKQIGMNDWGQSSSYRFHIYKFEIYGKMVHFSQYITCNKSSQRLYGPIVYIIIMTIK